MIVLFAFEGIVLWFLAKYLIYLHYFSWRGSGGL